MGAAAELLQLLRMSWALLLGNTVEWYEFAVYGHLEPYLEENFFHGSAIATWLGFAVTFAARPLGGLVLGRLGDVLGRKRAVNISIVAMLVGTCGQGLLPTYASGSRALGHVGLALLVLFRFVQGVSAAGEVSMIATYILEAGPRSSLCRGAAILAMTGQVAWLSAKFVVFVLEAALSAEAMRRWGWRVPFLLALLPGLVAVWGRRWLPETQLFLEEQRRRQKAAEAAREEGTAGAGARPGGAGLPEGQAAGGRPQEDAESPAPALDAAGDSPAEPPRAAPPRPNAGAVRAVLVSHGANVAIGTLGVAAFAVHAYGGLVWTQAYLLKRGLSPGHRMLTDLCGRGIMLLLALPVGWLADVLGVGWVTFAGSGLVAAGGLPLFALLAAHAEDAAVVVLGMGVGLGAMGALVGTIAFLFVAELFPTRVRGVAVGVSYNVGVCMFGGLSPLAFQASLGVSRFGPGVLLSLSGLLSCGAIAVGVRLHRRGLVQMAHVRPVPYFHPFDAPGPQAKLEPALDCEQNSDDSPSVDRERPLDGLAA